MQKAARMKKRDNDELDLSHKEFMTLDKNYAQAAAMVDLIYVKDDITGISRKPVRKGFSYAFKKKPVKDKKTIERIRKLAIPPAWKNVWICPKPSGHIQATGWDVRARKQYRYHTLWSKVRSETKFHRLYEFGNALPAMRKHLERDIQLQKMTVRKVLAAVILLMERTYIRIGNEGYEKMNGSYGLTTLKDKHVRFRQDEMNLAFKGKKGIHHNITLQNKRLARVIKECRDIPGEELFQYYDDHGRARDVDSGMVNEYIKEISGMDFSAKDFRLWAGSLNLLLSFKSIGQAANSSVCKQNILLALDEVSHKLGNTRTVCRKYYVHPGLIRLYEENNLAKYTKELDTVERLRSRSPLTQEEKVLMKILKTFH